MKKFYFMFMILLLATNGHNKAEASSPKNRNTPARAIPQPIITKQDFKAAVISAFPSGLKYYPRNEDDPCFGSVGEIAPEKLIHVSGQYFALISKTYFGEEDGAVCKGTVDVSLIKKIANGIFKLIYEETLGYADMGLTPAYRILSKPNKPLIVEAETFQMGPMEQHLTTNTYMIKIDGVKLIKSKDETMTMP